MTGIPLSALAHVVRSKNAGPTQLTIDVFFNDQPSYDHALASAALAERSVAALYRLDAAQVQRHVLPGILAMKFTMPRRICAGTPGDGDVYGAQQHTPMLGLLL
jgi:Domain of unknown function (DUF4387)